MEGGLFHLSKEIKKRETRRVVQLNGQRDSFDVDHKIKSVKRIKPFKPNLLGLSEV